MNAITVVNYNGWRVAVDGIGEAQHALCMITAMQLAKSEDDMVKAMTDMICYGSSLISVDEDGLHHIPLERIVQ